MIPAVTGPLDIPKLIFTFSPDLLFSRGTQSSVFKISSCDTKLATS